MSSKECKGPGGGLHTEKELRFTRRRGSVLREFFKIAIKRVVARDG